MDKKKIRERLPEPQPNKQQKADGTSVSPAIAKPNVVCSQSNRIRLSNIFNFFSVFKRLKSRLTFKCYKRRGIKIMYSSPYTTVKEDLEFVHKQFLCKSQKGLMKRLLLRLLGLKKLF